MTDYSKTVHLPQSLLPMKADLPKQEPKWLEFWAQNDVYKKMLLLRRGKAKYVLHDGPPYANGHIHMGHALNKILKDIIVKSRAMSGHYAPYVPGWDCHGLPIEHQLMKDLKKDKHTVDHLEFRKKAADFAKNFVQIQKKEFQRLGIFGDWEHPYLTLTPAYETIILKTFRELFEQGYVYRDKKPVQWCPSCETALAEAEVEYEEKESPAIFVKFKMAGAANRFIVIWTTTPWTLPANVGFMFHPDFEYVTVRIKASGEEWVLAKALYKNLLENKLKLSADQYEVVRAQKGSEFQGQTAERIFPETGRLLESKVVFSQEVSSEEGSGIVHTAPGHGALDYAVGHVQNKLPILSPVDDGGKFDKDINHPELEGLFVLSKGNAKILELLTQKGLLIHQEKIRHSYPHCWRCKNPVIFRATHQWFLKVDYAKPGERETLRRKLLAQIGNVQWVPDYGQNRIQGMIEQRPDWCLSRQRLWGTPIPIFYCKKDGEPLANAGAINMVEEKIGLEADGSDAWFRESPAYFLDHAVPFKCEKCGGQEFVKGNDILDVWFDSGVSSEAVLRQGDDPTITGETWQQALSWPADLYLEGSDQHRGWFQSSLIPSVALHGRPPYKGVLTHGFIVDGQGKKMSKSLGNVIAPEDILKNYGADILRLWVAASDYREDIRLSQDILKGVAENYRKIRNTFRYLVGNLADFKKDSDALPYERLTEIDRWALMRLAKTIQSCKKAYGAYEFHRVAVAATEFCAVDCSAFYFDVLKDRLYTLAQNDPVRRGSQTVLYEILSALLRLLAPVLSFTCEEVWQLGRQGGHWTEESVFFRDFPDIQPRWADEELKEKWEQVLRIREKANLALEAARQEGKIGGSLAAKVVFSGGSAAEKTVLRSLEKELPGLLIVSQVEMRNGEDPLNVAVQDAAGAKCLRCWRYQESVRPDGPQAGLCDRCAEALR